MKTEVPTVLIPFIFIGIFCLCFFGMKMILKTQDLYFDIRRLKEDVKVLQKEVRELEIEKYKREK